MPPKRRMLWITALLAFLAGILAVGGGYLIARQVNPSLLAARDSRNGANEAERKGQQADGPGGDSALEPNGGQPQEPQPRPSAESGEDTGNSGERSDDERKTAVDSEVKQPSADSQPPVRAIAWAERPNWTLAVGDQMYMESEIGVWSTFLNPTKEATWDYRLLVKWSVEGRGEDGTLTVRAEVVDAKLDSTTGYIAPYAAQITASLQSGVGWSTTLSLDPWRREGEVIGNRDLPLEHALTIPVDGRRLAYPNFWSMHDLEKSSADLCLPYKGKSYEVGETWLEPADFPNPAPQIFGSWKGEYACRYLGIQDGFPTISRTSRLAHVPAPNPPFEVKYERYQSVETIQFDSVTGLFKDKRCEDELHQTKPVQVVGRGTVTCRFFKTNPWRP